MKRVLRFHARLAELASPGDAWVPEGRVPRGHVRRSLILFARLAELASGKRPTCEPAYHHTQATCPGWDRYLGPDSDLVALMVLEHQVTMRNRLAKGALRVRRWMRYQRTLQEERKQRGSDLTPLPLKVVS